jgi:2-polyprenyl-6-methoxyphenol hydroxylase-like FAD-dependent oxidoreductase
MPRPAQIAEQTGQPFADDLAAPERCPRTRSRISLAAGVLRQALLSGLEEHTCFGKTFTAYEERLGGVTARFHDGSAAVGDILVGADGVHSRVRRCRLPEAAPRHTGIVGIFGRTPLTRVSLPALGPILANAGILAMGPRGRVCFCTESCFARYSERRAYSHETRPDPGALSLGFKASGLLILIVEPWPLRNSPIHARPHRTQPVAGLHHFVCHEITVVLDVGPKAPARRLNER